MVIADPRIACAKRTEQQIRAIVRDELQRAFVPPMKLVTDGDELAAQVDRLESRALPADEHLFGAL